MFRRVGRTHTGAAEGKHGGQLVAAFIRGGAPRTFWDLVFFIVLSPCTRVHRHEGGREKRVKATEGKRERERQKRGMTGSMRKTLHWNYRRERSRLRVGSLCTDPPRSYEESSGGIYTFFTPESRTQRIIAGLCLIMRAARALPFTKPHVRNCKRRHKESAFLS